MPCIIITGHPSAGKTTLSYLLKERALLHDAIDEVVVVNEESECGCLINGDNNEDVTSNFTTKQELYMTPAAEKQTRGALKSAFDRAVKNNNNNKNTSRRLVILDSLNYIKGFRYELHCISKAAGEKHAILWVLNRLSVVQQWNKGSNSHIPEKKKRQQHYSPELLQELISRYEPPDSRNRWDQPLFTVDLATAAGSSLPASNKDDEVLIKNELLSSNETRTSTRNEVLEQSVYNMHALGDSFGASTETIDNKSRSTNNALNPAARTINPPKKSAFQRKKKTITPSDKHEKKISAFNDEYNHDFPITISTCPVSNTIIGSGKSSNTNHHLTSNSMISDQSFNSAISKPQPSSQTQQQNDNKPLQEQLDEILDIFLLKTNNLKEGMSTRQYS